MNSYILSVSDDLIMQLLRYLFQLSESKNDYNNSKTNKNNSPNNLNKNIDNLENG